MESALSLMGLRTYPRPVPVREKLRRFMLELDAKFPLEKLDFEDCKDKNINEPSAKISLDEFKLIGDILKSGKLQPAFELNLSYINIDEEAAAILADAIATGNCPESFKLNLYGTNIGNAEAIQLARALKSGKCPIEFILSLEFNKNIDTIGMQAIVDALPFCPEYFKLHIINFDTSNSKKSPFEAFIAAIKNKQSKYWPRGFWVCVDQFLPLMQAVTQGLKQGNFPEDFQVEFGYFNATKPYIQADDALCEAFSSSLCPKGIGLNHRYPPFIKNFWTFSKKDSVMQLLENGNYPENFYLDLSYQKERIHNENKKFPSQSEYHASSDLAHALQKNKGPSLFLEMDFIISDGSKTYFLHGWSNILEALKYNKTVTQFSINKINLSMAEGLLQVLKVNDTLTNTSFIYQDEVPDKIVEEICSLELQNKMIQFDQAIVPFLYPPGISDIVLKYFINESKREIHKDAYKALESKDFKTFYFILLRDPAILNKTLRRNEKKIFLGEYVKEFLESIILDLDKPFSDFIKNALKEFDKQHSVVAPSNPYKFWNYLLPLKKTESVFSSQKPCLS